MLGHDWVDGWRVYIRAICVSIRACVRVPTSGRRIPLVSALPLLDNAAAADTAAYRPPHPTDARPSAYGVPLVTGRDTASSGRPLLRYQGFLSPPVTNGPTAASTFGLAFGVVGRHSAPAPAPVRHSAPAPVRPPRTPSAASATAKLSVPTPSPRRGAPSPRGAAEHVKLQPDTRHDTRGSCEWGARTRTGRAALSR